MELSNQTPNQQFMFRNSFYLGVLKGVCSKGYVWGSLRITLTVFPTCEPLIYEDYEALVVSLKVKHRERWPNLVLLIGGVFCVFCFFWGRRVPIADKVLMITLVYTWSQDWMVVSNMFYFHPYLGKIPISTNIFQMGLVQPPNRRGFVVENFGMIQVLLHLQKQKIP